MRRLASQPVVDSRLDSVGALALDGDGARDLIMAPQIATNRSVDRDEMLAFLRPRHHVILSTTRADGGTQFSPVTCGLDSEGRLVVSTYPSRAKVRNLRRRPRAAACVLSDDWNGPWVQIEGMAEVLDLPEALEPLVEYFRSISGEHPDWDEYAAAMQRQGKCLIRVAIGRWGPVATGGFPAEVAND
jgi:PPOX class probable F420-dependent enzyme